MTEEGVASPGAKIGTPGGEGQTWQEQFLGGDEYAELRDNETIKTTPDIPNLAKALIHNKSLVGRKGVILPKEDAPPEEMERFYTELGRPAAPELYEIKPEGLPEGFPYSPELENKYRTLAYEAGLSPTQAKKIYDGYNKFALEQFENGQVELKARVAEIQGGLQKEWGSKFEENMALARSAMNRVAPPGSPELLALDKAIGDSPVMVKFFYNLGKSMSEGSFISGAGSQGSDIETKRQELMRNPAYLDEKNPDHKAIVAQVTEIYKQIHPVPVEQ